jgi:phage baseplate assembly protein W
MAIEFFKDLPLDFTPHPVSGDVRPIVNEIAVKRAIKNLVFTKKGSKPFFPTYGSDVQDFIFRNADSFTKYDLEQSLYETIKSNEPRVNVTLIDVQFEDNGLKILIEYVIRNIGQVSSLTLSVKRNV